MQKITRYRAKQGDNKSWDTRYGLCSLSGNFVKKLFPVPLPK